MDGGEVTRLLSQVREGDRDAADRLIPLIYAELRRVAGALMQGERPDHTLQPTALVHEAYLRLNGSEPVNWQNRAHFFAVAAHTMRQILVDYARRRKAEKRGGPDARQVDIEESPLMTTDKLEDVLAVDEALQRLALLDARQSQLVELRYFAGLSIEEAAEVMEVSPVTIKREWRSARAWLRNQVATTKTP